MIGVKVGDRVQLRWYEDDTDDPGTVLAVDGNTAWVKWDNGSRAERSVNDLRVLNPYVVGSTVLLSGEHGWNSSIERTVLAIFTHDGTTYVAVVDKGDTYADPFIVEDDQVLRAVTR